MRKLVAFAALVAALCGPAFAIDISARLGASSPYFLAPGFGEPNATIPSPPGNYNAGGKTYKTLSSLTGSKTLVITWWQSLGAISSAGAYATVNATSLNYNLGDRGVYNCANIVVGPSTNTAGLGTNSPTCAIADGLVTAGTYANVFMAPIAIGGSKCSDWNGGILQQRIVVLMNGLKARGLTAATGFVGDTWIVSYGGETDATAGTPRAPLATCMRGISPIFIANGLGAHRHFIAKQSMVGNVTNATVQGAQADAVSSGCANCRTGPDRDSLTGGTNRQADGTHLTQQGALNSAALDVAAIQACKAAVC